MKNQEKATSQDAISPLQVFKSAVPIESTDATGRYPDVYQQFSPDHIISSQQEGNTFLFTTTNRIKLKVEVLSENIIRFRYTHQRKFERDFSYAIDPKFEATEVKIDFLESEDHFSIKTQQIDCQIFKAQALLKILDKGGQLICEDAQPYRALSTLLNGLSEVRISYVAHGGENYFGLGDKSSKLNLRGQKKENWNTDAFAYDADRDPLYRTIPFYFGLHQNIGYGIFFDNTYRTHFDFDSEANGMTSFYAEGGEVNYYFIYGPELLQVAQAYTKLTGTPELPPMWALGFHQCRWSYFPESRVREIADEFRKRQIPCDAIYLDIDYMDGYRCFTWNHDHFPNPKEMITDLAGQGFQTVVMIDPGLKADEDYWVYRSGLEHEVYCNRTTGETMIGPVWPPACVFPDYTRPDVRAWWGKLYKGLYVEQGISGFWNDMNEPAMFKVDRGTFPDAVLHDYEGELTDHRKAHNIYGLQMSRATTEGLQQLRPNKRPFLVTRATYSGGQRFAAVWTGDNVASWEHLHIANTQCQRLSISGFSFVGSDIGGFAGTPTGELMVRWMQLGIFHPFYRIHSMGNNVDGASETSQDEVAEKERFNRLDQEPWVFGTEYEALIKEAVELRYRLLPYIYSTFWQNVNHGTPMIRSMVFYDQSDAKNYELESQFMFGDHLLICPVEQASTLEGFIQEEKEEEAKEISEQLVESKVLEEDLLDKKIINEELKTTLEEYTELEEDKALEPITEQSIYLPKGTWYDFHTAEQHKGQQKLTQAVDLAKIPIFVKAGAVLPFYPIQQYVGEQDIEQLELRIFHINGKSETQFYEDAGEGHAYQDGEYSLKTFEVEGDTQSLTIRRQQEGFYEESYGTYRICVYGLSFEVEQCRVDGEEVIFNQKGGNNYIEIILNKSFEEVRLF
ncbi:MAG: TIM-barrel domain-containing protein [Bacteroidota bacterium]